MKANHKQAAATFSKPRDVEGLTSRLAKHFAGTSGGSNYGAQCERMQVIGYTSRKCPGCHGAGFLEVGAKGLAEWAVRLYRCNNPEEKAQLREQLSRESTCQTCKGTGHIDGSKIKGERKPFAVTKRCFRCKGCGEVMNEDLEDVCQNCMGEMFTVPITVQETGCSKNGRVPKREPDDGSDRNERVFDAPLKAGEKPEDQPAYNTNEDTREAAYGSHIDEASFLEYGEMSRLLVRLAQHDEASASVLRAYLGPEGDRWAPHKWGRLFAVWPLTKPGAQLAREAADRSSRGHGFLLAPIELLASERDAEQKTTTPNARRRNQIRLADEYSRRLLDAAMAALRAVAK